MGQLGPEFYDDDSVFATYMAMRARSGNANETLEKPVFDELAGELFGLRILDLGCGDAHFGREALHRGCRAYLGIEGSENMHRLAQANLAGSSGEAILTTIEEWSFPERRFDLVTSRLALHYIEDFAMICDGVIRALVGGGRFVFSVEHPVITSSNQAGLTGGKRQAWIVDEYFKTGARATSWMGSQVVKYHRTVEDYFGALHSAGFIIDAVRESRPQRAMFADEETYQRRQRIPLMLFFAASRPALHRSANIESN